MTRAYSFSALGASAMIACGGSNANTMPGGAGDLGASGNSSGTSSSGGAVGMAGSTSTGGKLSSAGAPPVSLAGRPNTGISEGTPGVWEDITPSGVSLQQQDPGGGDNYGVQDVLADPARSTDLYAFICYQGVWRSSDYGDSWTQVNAGSNWGKPWGTAIQPNPDRDPTKAPVLYAGGSNPVGLLRSLDFGVTWTEHPLPMDFGDFRYQQVYSIDINPYDSQHIIVAFHEAPDVGESTDGGKTWVKHLTPAEDGGTSYYPFFVQTGDAATTRKTWLAVPQETGNSRALRTTDGGASWTKLNQFQHHHGSAQLFDAGGGLIFLSAMQPAGIHKSTDYGSTWTSLSAASSGVVTASKKNLYASVGVGYAMASSGFDPQLVTAPRDNDTAWVPMTRPPGMFDGAKRMAVTHDEAHDLVVSGNWHAGIWRYIEP